MDLELGLLASDAAERKRIAPHTAFVLARIARPLLRPGQPVKLLATLFRQTHATCTVSPALTAGKAQPFSSCIKQASSQRCCKYGLVITSESTILIKFCTQPGTCVGL